MRQWVSVTILCDRSKYGEILRIMEETALGGKRNEVLRKAMIVRDNERRKECSRNAEAIILAHHQHGKCAGCIERAHTHTQYICLL